MNLSFKLKTQSKNPKGESPLYLRMRYSDSNGKTTESSIHTGVEILPQHFKNGDIIIKTPNYSSKRLKLDSIISDIEKILSELQSDGVLPYPKVVKERYDDLIKVKEISSPKSITFWGGYKEFMDTKKHKSRGYTKTFISLKNRLEDFEKFKKIRLSFDYVVGNSFQFQTQFQNFLWEKKKLSNGYINKLFENLSNYLYFCFKSNYISQKPKFDKNDTIENLEKIYLYEEEVLKLSKSTQWDYVEGKDYSKNPHIYIITDILEGTKKEKYGDGRRITNWELVKDIFLFQCSIGCRYSDILHFKVNHFDFGGNRGTFSWVQQKTDKRVSVPINPISDDIYRKYSRGKSLTQNLFPKLSNQKFNKSLKLILKDLKFNRLVSKPKKIGSKVVEDDNKFLWEMISSHSGRKTFIKNMIDLGSMDYMTIMSMTGHKTIREFQKYVSVSPHDLDKGRELYRKIKREGNDENEELIKLFEKLDDDKRSLVFSMIRTLVK
jgi:integrase